MTPRTTFTLALIPATLAAHLLVAACGGSEGTSQAGPGAGGSGGSGSGSGAGGAASVTTGAGVTTGSTTTGSSGGSPLPQCDCAPKPPLEVVVACEPDGNGGAVAVYDSQGRPPAELARVSVVAERVIPLKHSNISYSHERPATLIGDGRIFVDCFNYMGSPTKIYNSVTFVVPVE